jgi:hypothetical protein
MIHWTNFNRKYSATIFKFQYFSQRKPVFLSLPYDFYYLSHIFIYQKMGNYGLVSKFFNFVGIKFVCWFLVWFLRGVYLIQKEMVLVVALSFQHTKWWVLSAFKYGLFHFVFLFTCRCSSYILDSNVLQIASPPIWLIFSSYGVFWWREVLNLSNFSVISLFLFLICKKPLFCV